MKSDELLMIGAAVLVLSSKAGGDLFAGLAKMLGKTAGDAGTNAAGGVVKFVSGAMGAPYDAGVQYGNQWRAENTQAIANQSAPGSTGDAWSLYTEQMTGNLLAGNYGDLLGGVNSPGFLALERAAGVNQAALTNPAFTSLGWGQPATMQGYPNIFADRWAA